MKNLDNKLLSKLALKDQEERKTYVGNEEKVARNDEKRRSAVDKLIAEKKLMSARDYFNAALIYQHGLTINSYKRAKELAEISVKMGLEEAKWLFAAATDRLLVAQGKKQKFGTQYRTVIIYNKNLSIKKKVIRISPFDKRTTDKMRKRYNVPSLKDLLSMEKVYTKEFFGETS